METNNLPNESTADELQSQQSHISTYTPGEDPNRLASAAQYFGIRNTRTPLRPIREQTTSTTINTTNNTNNYHGPTEHDSKSILKFGSTVWNNVGMIFSDSTLEAARMHSVGVTAKNEHVAGDGTLRLRSIVRRMKKKNVSHLKLNEMFQPLNASDGQEVIAIETVKTDEEDVEYEEVIVDTIEGGSIPAAIFGIIKGMVGPAVLYLPRGFALSGYAVAIPAMFCATVSYLYCATRLLQCWKVESDKLTQQMEQIRRLLDPEHGSSGLKSNKVDDSHGGSGGEYGSLLDGSKYNDQTLSPAVEPEVQGKLLTYPELARKAFGNFAFLISGGIAGMQFGVCLTYLIFVPQNFYELFHDVFGIIVPKQLILLGMLIIEIPLCWIRDIRKLTPINILATVLIAFGLCAVLFIALFNHDRVTDVDGNELTLIQEISHLPRIQDTWALFIGTSFFCFEGSITLVVPLQEAVYNKTDRAIFPAVNQKVTSSIVVFYMFFGFICWASFGDSVQTALTASLPKGSLSTIVQFAYSVAVIFTFPLQAFPALEVVCDTTQTKTGRSSKSQQEAIIFRRNVTASAIICLLGLIAVIATNYLGNVVSLLGSLVGIPIALIYPPLMHNRLVKDSSPMTKFLNVFLSGVGVFAAAAASYTTIISWNEGAEG